jgi:hypothetical protein
MTNISFCTSKAKHFLRLNSILQPGLLTVCSCVPRFAENIDSAEYRTKKQKEEANKISIVHYFVFKEGNLHGLKAVDCARRSQNIIP